MTMATQYANTRASYTFTIVHPSNADIRFISADNSSSDGERCLRVSNNGSGTQFVTLSLGDWMPDSSTNYTAAFAIVNEQNQYVNLTYVNISGTNATYLDMWVHGNRSTDAPSEAGAAAVQIVDNGAALFSASDTVWTLAPGDGDVTTISADYRTSGGQTHLPVIWDTGANMWYNDFSANYSSNKSSDFVWVQICLDIDKDAAISGSASTGTIYFHFQASQ
jgi:hypothetical protein